MNARLATSMRWRDRESGDRRERTEWHRIVVFGNGAKLLGEYARKGAQVYVERSPQTREGMDREGVKRFTTEVAGQGVQLLGKKSEAAAPPTDESPAEDEPEESTTSRSGKPRPSSPRGVLLLGTSSTK